MICDCLEADCDDEVETHRDQRKGNISQNNEQKQQVAQHKDGMSQQLKIFDVRNLKAKI